ncbi:MAG: hypothetical protein IKF90_05940 [Parasporobacterium sp.]|nr:hypothetical protein [Parasporobacterium sp.]
MEKDTAYLSNYNEYISFKYGDREIRFKGPYSLVKIDKVISWDKGYLVVNSYYSHNSAPEEDYIDLIPILDKLYIDPETFLEPIKKVEVHYV